MIKVTYEDKLAVLNVLKSKLGYDTARRDVIINTLPWYKLCCFVYASVQTY